MISCNDEIAYDLDSDGAPELIAGWSNGKLEVRSMSSGELLFKVLLSLFAISVLPATYPLSCQ
jgi:hypothetical protein